MHTTQTRRSLTSDDLVPMRKQKSTASYPLAELVILVSRLIGSDISAKTRLCTKCRKPHKTCARPIREHQHSKTKHHQREPRVNRSAQRSWPITREDINGGNNSKISRRLEIDLNLSYRREDKADQRSSLSRPCSEASPRLSRLVGNPAVAASREKLGNELHLLQSAFVPAFRDGNRQQSIYSVTLKPRPFCSGRQMRVST
jgi:hypothetical protein